MSGLSSAVGLGVNLNMEGILGMSLVSRLLRRNNCFRILHTYEAIEAHLVCVEHLSGGPMSVPHTEGYVLSEGHQPLARCL